MICAKCGDSHETKGSCYCRPCKREYQREWYKTAKSRSRKPGQVMLSAAKKRAKAKGFLFDLDIVDIVIPDICPALGIALIKGDGVSTDSSPALDRIIPSKGYVKGNVAVISTRANRIKSNATYSEIQMVADWVKEN